VINERHHAAYRLAKSQASAGGSVLARHRSGTTPAAWFSEGRGRLGYTSAPPPSSA